MEAEAGSGCLCRRYPFPSKRPIVSRSFKSNEIASFLCNSPKTPTWIWVIWIQLDKELLLWTEVFRAEDLAAAVPSTLLL